MICSNHNSTQYLSFTKILQELFCGQTRGGLSGYRPAAEISSNYTAGTRLLYFDGVGMTLKET
jgi:hypothetical protein